VLDSDGAYKAAAFELRRLYAPAHHSIQHEVGQDTAKLWVLLDNTHAPVRGEAVLEARRLSDGKVLERWQERVELWPGQRRACIEARVSQFAAPGTLLWASFLGAHTFRLLSEPKDAKLEAPLLRASAHPEGVLLETDRPVVDLFVWDSAERLELLDNFVTLPAAGKVVLRARGGFESLQGRSLAGRHVIES
jgi:hypothetical protein